MQLVSFLLYVFVTSFTPGPNNIMAMAYANKYGFRKSLTFIFGVTAGIAVISLLSSYFNLLLYSFIPKIKVVMSMLGGLYLVYLAMKMMMNKPSGKKEHNEKSISFLAGFILQFINPKVIVYGITAISTFVIPFYHSNSSLVLFSLFLAFAGFLGTTCWAIFGAIFQKVLSKYEKAFHIFMGLLLLYSAVSIFVE
jgi:cysteine/O-acetylserine efflux protein